MMEIKRAGAEAIRKMVTIKSGRRCYTENSGNKERGRRGYTENGDNEESGRRGFHPNTTPLPFAGL